MRGVISRAVFVLALPIITANTVDASFTFVNDSSISAALADGMFGQLSQVSADGYTSTVDHDTGLEWLDVSVTRGLSIDAVNSLISGGPLKGFRYATIPEILDFTSNSGFVGEMGQHMNLGSHFFDAAVQLNHHWGYSANGILPFASDGESIGGLTFFAESWNQFGLGAFKYGDGRVEFFAGTFTPFWLQSPQHDLTGHALVRVPEPSGALLFGIGSFLLTAVRLRRKLY